MGAYMYGITKEEEHPEIGTVGVLEFLYKPWANTYDGSKRNDRLHNKYAKPIIEAYKGRKVPKYIKYIDGSIRHYKGRSPVWLDSKENLIGDRVGVA